MPSVMVFDHVADETARSSAGSRAASSPPCLEAVSALAGAIARPNRRVRSRGRNAGHRRYNTATRQIAIEYPHPVGVSPIAGPLRGKSSEGGARNRGSAARKERRGRVEVGRRVCPPPPPAGGLFRASWARCPIAAGDSGLRLTPRAAPGIGQPSSHALQVSLTWGRERGRASARLE